MPIWLLRAFVVMVPMLAREEFSPGFSGYRIPNWKVVAAVAAALACLIVAIHDYRRLRERRKVGSPGSRGPYLPVLFGTLLLSPVTFFFLLWDMSLLTAIVFLPYAIWLTTSALLVLDTWNRGRAPPIEPGA
jgi:hypothetical protein